MPVHAVHVYGVAGTDFIQIPARWNRLHRPERFVPACAYDPFSGASRFYFGADTLTEFIQRFRAHQIDAELFLARVSQMHVGVIKTGHYKTSTQVDDLGVRTFGLQNFIARSDCENAITPNRDCFGAFSRDHRCRVHNSGINIPVRENDVGPGLLGRVLPRHARRNDENQDQSSSHYSPLPASASIVSRMRFRPRSLPLQSNHSCNVCAPPPDPPPPMAMASRPSESGMFASVDARCTCAALPRCASTARITFSTRASGVSSPAGRFPISTTSLWTMRRRCSGRSEEHTSELQSQSNLVCRLLLEK